MLLSRSQKPFILTQIVDFLARLSEKHPRKYIMLKFSNDGLDLSTKDDTSTIFIGVKLNKKVFSAYICQNNTNLLLPLQKLCKILNLPGQFDDSITLSFQSPSDELKFRIYSTKNNLKTIINLQIPQLQSQNIMINEQYEEPASPIKQLQKLKSEGHVHTMMMNNNSHMTNNKIDVSQSQFLIPCVEFYRICKEFSDVCEKFSISLQAQEGSNKKYMIFSGMTGNGIKTISLNQERSQQEIEQSIISNSRITIRQTFLTSAMLKIASISLNSQLFEENIRIVLERKKSIFLVYYIVEDQGQVVFMSAPLPTYF